MGIFPFVSCPCPCWPNSSSTRNPNSSTPQQSSQQDQSNHSESEPTERTPLITNPPQITHSPFFPIVDIAQQQADEAAANKIVNETVRCLVDVYSQAPFSHLRIQEPHQPADSVQHHTPDGSSSTWRAYDPPICPPISSQGCTLILGFEKVQSCSDSQCTPKTDVGHNQKATHQQSFHSLKTIVNHHSNQTSRQSGNVKRNQQSLPSSQTIESNLSQPSSSSSHHHQPNTPSEPLLDNSEITPPHSRQNSIAHTSCSTQFNTINSFQTARDDTDSEIDLPVYLTEPAQTISDSDSRPHTLPTSTNGLIEKPEFVRNLWNNLHHSSPTGSSSHQPNPSIIETDQTNGLDHASLHLSEQGSDYLTDDPIKLTELISNGFQLKDPGPIIVEL